MTDEKHTISRLIDATNATLARSEKFIASTGLPPDAKARNDELQAAAAALKLLVDGSHLLAPEDFKRVFGCERK